MWHEVANNAIYSYKINCNKLILNIVLILLFYYTIDINIIISLVDFSNKSFIF